MWQLSQSESLYPLGPYDAERVDQMSSFSVQFLRSGEENADNLLALLFLFREPGSKALGQFTVLVSPEGGVDLQCAGHVLGRCRQARQNRRIDKRVRECRPAETAQRHHSVK